MEEINTVNTQKARSNYFDNIKGLLIILVVFAHCLFSLQHNYINNIIVDLIYFFHMPAFVFISGYFSKSNNSRSGKAFLKFFIAYLLIISIYIFSDVFSGKQPHFLSAYRSEWYLVALIVWRLLTIIIDKFPKHKKTIIVISFAISILSGFWINIGGNQTLSINKIVAFLPFFLLGYYTSPNLINKIKETNRNKKYIIWLSSFLLMITIQIVTYLTLNISDYDLLPNSYLNFSYRDVLARLSIFIVSTLFIISILYSFSNKKIPFLTKFGEKSFTIFLIHRPITVIFTSIVYGASQTVQLISALILTILICVVFSLNIVSNFVDKILNYLADIFLPNKKTNYIVNTIFCSFIIVLALSPIFAAIVHNYKNKDVLVEDKYYRVMDYGTQEEFENSVKLLFCGDLILLEDQVKNGFNGTDYNFDSCFEYTKKYIEAADFSIGVFEGPLAGADAGYSSSNFDDNKQISLNYPDEWADSIKNAGFDFLTLANNHLLDKGVSGAQRTIQVLNNKDIAYTGAYSSIQDKNNNSIKLVDVMGLKVAILSYTYGSNGYDEDYFFNDSSSYITSIIVSPTSKNYTKNKNAVKADFEKAKSLNPDFIICLPHWGTQFMDQPDNFQETWNQNFIEFGANIVFGDHTHSVQPVGIAKNNTFTLYCPGNYTNIYRKYNGDCSSLVEVYINKDTKKIIGGGIIPMWINSSLNGNYRPLPIYDILTDNDLKSNITTYDLERIKEVFEHITQVMLNEKIDFSIIQEKYYFDTKGFLRVKVDPIELTETMNTDTLNLFESAQSICFIGDSITEGTKNGGVPWYEPLESAFLKNKKVINISKGGATIKNIIENYYEDIYKSKADLYIVAIGTNDVRYRNNECALTSADYINQIIKLRNLIKSSNEHCKIIFVAPWTSTDGDIYCPLSYKEKIALNTVYSNALENFASSQNDYFINANSYIDYYYIHYSDKTFLIDHIHPNSSKGVELFTKAFLEYSN